MACAPSKDSDQPGHLPSLIRVFAVHMKKTWVLNYPLSAQQRLWSDWADAQVYLSLYWAHMPFCRFCHTLAHFMINLHKIYKTGRYTQLPGILSFFDNDACFPSWYLQRVDSWWWFRTLSLSNIPSQFSCFYLIWCSDYSLCNNLEVTIQKKSYISCITDLSIKCRWNWQIFRPACTGMQSDEGLNPFLAEHDMPCLSKQCRSRSVGFWRSQLIWICTVCH